MRKQYIISVLITVLFSFRAPAQQSEYQGQMHITPILLEQRGDSLYVRLHVDISGVNVDSRRSISLIPALVSDEHQLNLPEIMIKGRENYLVYQREVALMSSREQEKYALSAPYTVLKGYKAKSDRNVEYVHTLKYEPWMADARLDMYEDLCGCGSPARRMGVSMLVNAVSLERIINEYAVSPRLAFMQPAIEEVKHREISGEAFLDFVVNKIDIRPGYMNNPRELKKITDLIAEVSADKDITIRSINVIGFASPEGPLNNNKWLSEGRANALVGYLVPRFNFPRNMYKIVFGGENWSGLHRMVEENTMDQKEAILAILNDSTITDDQRKLCLKNFANGVPYLYMLREWYPSLRVAICKIEFDVKNFNIDQAKEVIKSRPQNLSLNEMFLVANTYETGSQEFIDLFEIAVRIFPNDPTANLNAATAALSRGDKVYAQRYLERIGQALEIAEYYNTAGVLAMLEEEYEKAGAYLSKAAEMGLDEAVHNLEELERKRENTLLMNRQK